MYINAPKKNNIFICKKKRQSSIFGHFLVKDCNIFR